MMGVCAIDSITLPGILDRPISRGNWERDCWKLSDTLLLHCNYLLNAF